MALRRRRPARLGSRLIQLTGWAGVVALVLAAMAPAAASVNAPGNNGTVKIHEGSTEAEPIVRNEPHVCTFHLHFFFADPFQAGSWEIQEWAPGDKGTVVLTGTYDTNGDGEDRDPDAGAYELPDGHYKLFWDGDTGKHDKHKVFWVDCQGGAAETEVPETEAPTMTFEESFVPETEAPTMTFEESFEAETEAPESEVPETDVPETEAPTMTFEQSFVPETDVPETDVPETEAPTMTFEQSFAADTEVPSVTLPPTSTPGSPGPTSEGWRMVLLGLAFLLGSLLVLGVRPPKAQPRP